MKYLYERERETQAENDPIAIRLREGCIENTGRYFSARSKLCGRHGFDKKNTGRVHSKYNVCPAYLLSL